MRLYGIEPDAPCAFEQTFPMCARRPWPSLHRNTPVLPSPERLHACARHTPPRRVCTEIPRTPRARRPHALPTPPLTYPSLRTPGRCPWRCGPHPPTPPPCPRPDLHAMPRVVCQLAPWLASTEAHVPEQHAAVMRLLLTVRREVRRLGLKLLLIMHDSISNFHWCTIFD